MARLGAGVMLLLIYVSTVDSYPEFPSVETVVPVLLVWLFAAGMDGAVDWIWRGD